MTEARNANLVFVIGGARSGKSTFAEARMAALAPPWTYIATAQAFDDEMRARIDMHRARRDERWRTIDAPHDLCNAVRHAPDDAPVLVDCLTLWLTNRLLAGADLVVEREALVAALAWPLGLYLARLYEALLDGGRGVVRPETVREFTRRQRTGLFDLTFRHAIDFGLGFILHSNRPGADLAPYGYGPHASEETYGHSGSQCSCGFADPARGLAVAWICNGLPGEPRHQRRQRAINAAIYEDLGFTA